MFSRKFAGFVLLICCMLVSVVSLLKADEYIEQPGETGAEKINPKNSDNSAIENNSIAAVDDSAKGLDPTKFPVDISAGGGKIKAVFYEGTLSPENLVEADLIKLPGGALVRITTLSESARKSQGKRVFKGLTNLIAKGAKFYIFDDEAENAFDEDGNRILKTRVDDRDISEVLKISE